MFAIRYVIAYIVYTPDDKIFESFIKQNESVNEESVETGQSNVEMQQIDPTSTVEFQDEQPEEIANVVRTMMSGQ